MQGYILYLHIIKNMRVTILDKAICWCVWCFLWTSTTGFLLVRPKTQTVAIGERVVMECSTNVTYGVDWHFVYENRKKEEIYSSRMFSPIYEAEYQIEKSAVDGVYNLVIDNVAQRHAGKYICIDDAGMGSDTASATLRIEDDNIQLDPPAVDTPEENNYGSKVTETDVAGVKTVDPGGQTTTIGEIPVTTATSPILLIVGLIVGLGFVLILLVIILIYLCLKGRCVRRNKMVDEDPKQNQSLIPTGIDVSTNKNLRG